jgi:hypothetical protein
MERQDTYPGINENHSRRLPATRNKPNVVPFVLVGGADAKVCSSQRPPACAF